MLNTYLFYRYSFFLFLGKGVKPESHPPVYTTLVVDSVTSVGSITIVANMRYDDVVFEYKNQKT